jgi:DNA-binding response OmpR family regulator
VQEANKLIENNRYTLAVVDRILPDGDGLEIVQLLDLNHYQTKILILSSKNTTQYKIDGLKNGADDYLAKPFLTAELKLRISKLLTKQKIFCYDCVVCDNIILYPDTGTLIIDGVQTQLRKKESEILECLLNHQGTIVTHNILVNHVWSIVKTPSRKTLSVYIRRLRMRLKSEGQRLQTVKGIGFKFS